MEANAMAVGFANFDEAIRALPRFLVGGLDLQGQHRTIDDLEFMVQHEIDLAVDGEENSIQCARQSDTSSRWRKCRAFVARCAASRIAA
jgi:hypothetical protein